MGLLDKVEVWSRKVSKRTAKKWTLDKEVEGVQVGAYIDDRGQEYPAKKIIAGITFGVAEGDWVVSDPEGNVRVVDKTTFDEKYSHVEGDTYQTKPSLRYVIKWDGKWEGHDGIMGISPMPFVDNDGNVFEDSIKTEYGTIGMNVGDAIIFHKNPKIDRDCSKYPCDCRAFEKTHERLSDTKAFLVEFDIMNVNGNASPIHYAATIGNEFAVRDLIEGIEIPEGIYKTIKPGLLQQRMTAFDKNRETPFHKACKMGHAKLARFFINKGVKVRPDQYQQYDNNTKKLSMENQHPIIYAIESRDIETLRAFLDTGYFDINTEFGDFYKNNGEKNEFDEAIVKSRKLVDMAREYGNSGAPSFIVSYCIEQRKEREKLQNNTAEFRCSV